MRMALLPFAVYVLLGAVLIWPQTDVVRAGVLQLMTGVAAWVLGCAMARAVGTDIKFDQFLTVLIVGIIGIQVVVCTLQFAGVPINALAVSESEILANRVNGTSNHPNNLGKMLICLLVLLLPLTEQDQRAYRKLALAGAVAIFVPLGLAQGRANFAAALAALAIWAMATPAGRQAGMKLTLAVGSFVAGLLSAAAFLSRFEEDPSGGVRPQILAIAKRAIPQHLEFGVGPNDYVDAIASRAGSFIPVHNTFVLLLAECGLIGLVLFVGPLLKVARDSLRWSRTCGHSRALISVAPGLGVIGWTGWGLLGTSIFPLLLFVVAYAYVAAMGRRATVQGPTAQSTALAAANGGMIQ